MGRGPAHAQPHSAGKGGADPGFSLRSSVSGPGHKQDDMGMGGRRASLRAGVGREPLSGGDIEAEIEITRQRDSRADQGRVRHFSDMGLVLRAASSPLGRPPGLRRTWSHPEQTPGSCTAAQFQQGWGGSGFGNLANRPGFDSSLAAPWHTALDKSLSPRLNASPRERHHPSSRDCWEALSSRLKVPPRLPGTCE